MNEDPPDITFNELGLGEDLMKAPLGIFLHLF